MSDIGFLGLGRMGAAIAERMVDAGVAVRVWNRSRSDSVDALTSAGATLAESAEHALGAPISFSMLADDEAAESVLSTRNIGNTEHPRIHVNMASISVRMADLLERRFADAGVWYVSSPVLGRPEVAAAGKLNVLLAGPAPALEAIEPYLAHCSVRRWPFGDRPRQANAVKISLNFMMLHALESMGEGIALVEAEGVDANQFVELMTSSFFGGSVHRGYGEMIANRRYLPAAFTVALGRKDLGLAEELAAESGVDIPTASVLAQRFDATLADPALAELDWSAIAEISRRRSDDRGQRA